MSELIPDDHVRGQLNGLNEAQEICDETGRVVGYYVPSALYNELFYAALAAESPHPRDELRRRHREGGGRSLQEIWRSLGRS